MQWNRAIEANSTAQWVFVIGDRKLATQENIQLELRAAFPNAQQMGCTTSGEIANDLVYDETLIVSVIEFSKTTVQAGHLIKSNHPDASDFEFGKSLAKCLDTNGLRYACVLCSGHNMNGTEFVQGLQNVLPQDVLITGGMAGDDDRFQETVVWHNASADPDLAVICGLYGDDLTIGHGTLGGWDPFGPNRLITRSEDNVLYELDGENALALYKTYLGDYAADLPASALLFPLEVSRADESDSVVRTILAVDEDAQSMTFAGDMPEGHQARLMRANFDRLVDGAIGAADQAVQSFNDVTPTFALLVSCVGRRLVLKQRVEEELEQVMDVLGTQCTATGFYSYGEISPLSGDMNCRLHNQTMTVTTFSER
jgi:hypothetical protein